MKKHLEKLVFYTIAPLIVLAVVVGWLLAKLL